MLGRWVFCVWVLVFSPFTFAVEATAQSLHDSATLGYWYDATGEASLAEARTATYRPFEGVLSEGYLPGSSWIRVHIPSLKSKSNLSYLALRIRPTYLNDVTLFDPALDWKPEQTGDAVDQAKYLLRPTNLGFRIPALSTGRDIYLRIQSTSTHLISVEVLTPDELLVADGFQTFWHGLFFGVVGLILLWAFFEWWGRRDRLLGRFLVKHLAVAVYSIGYLGYLTYLSSPDNAIFQPDLLFSFSIFVLIFVGLRFHVGVLREYGLARWGLNACRIFYLVPVFSVVLALIGSMQAALKICALVTLLVPVIVFSLVLLAKPRAQSRALSLAAAGDLLPTSVSTASSATLSKRLLLIYYGVILVFLGLGATQVLGLAKGNEFTLHVFLFHSVVSSVLLMTMLQIRSRVIQAQHFAATREMARAQGELAAERLAREEQGRMVEMLSHEIKTPLSVLQLAVEEMSSPSYDRRVADQSIQEIKSVVERSIAASKTAFSDEDAQAFDLVELVRQQIEWTGQASRFQVEAQTAFGVSSNRHMLEQVVGNLLDNALKYGAKDSLIRVKLSPNAHWRFDREQAGVEVSICNVVGCAGYPAADMVFKKYYRAEGARSRPGTGIGLYLVEQFARFLGGAVHYRPTQTHVEFVLWIPSKQS